MNTANRNSRYFTYIKPITKIPILRTYGTTIFTFVAMSIFALFAIKPTVETILVLQKKLENSQEILRQVTKKAEDLSKGKENYEKLEPNVKSKIQSAIPSNLNITTLILPFELSSSVNDATISAVQVQPLTIQNKLSTTFDKGVSSGNENKSLSSGNKLEEVAFIINIEAPYETLLTILGEIQTSPRLISIDTLIINKGSEESKNLLMSINGRAYFLR